PADGKIGIDGTIQYLHDLGLNLEEPAALVLAWKLAAPTTGEFHKAEFVEGWRSLDCDSFDAMKNKIHTFRRWMLEDEDVYHKVYLFVFSFAKVQGQKSLGLDTAIDYWELLLRTRFDHLDLWVQFLKEKHGRAISKDTWNQLWDFMKTYDKTFQVYDQDGAWPVLIDEVQPIIQLC
ncbi:Defective in cullin neddylation protein 1, partial [Neolecta irregularis DAH-3]